MKPTIKKGDSGIYVVEMQTKLGISADGIFGPVTEAELKIFQAKNGLVADGICGPMTWQVLDNNFPQKGKFDEIVDLYLPLDQDEYMTKTSKKVGICLHHTVSDGNPAVVKRVWNNDDRGRVATHFVVGNIMINGDISYNGQIVQCFPMENWAWHINTTRTGRSSNHNYLVNQGYIGIELCSLGCLKKQANGQFTDLSGKIVVPANQVCTLEKPFRSYKYWHKYSDRQIEKTYHLLQKIAKHQNLNLKLGYNKVDENWFDMSWEALSMNRTLTTHTNFEYGKFDVFPQPELIEMIKKL